MTLEVLAEARGAWLLVGCRNGRISWLRNGMLVARDEQVALIEGLRTIAVVTRDDIRLIRRVRRAGDYA